MTSDLQAELTSGSGESARALVCLVDQPHGPCAVVYGRSVAARLDSQRESSPFCNEYRAPIAPPLRLSVAPGPPSCLRIREFESFRPSQPVPCLEVLTKKSLRSTPLSGLLC